MSDPQQVAVRLFFLTAVPTGLHLGLYALAGRVSICVPPGIVSRFGASCVPLDTIPWWQLIKRFAAPMTPAELDCATVLSGRHIGEFVILAANTHVMHLYTSAG